MTDHARLARLVLQLERALAAQEQLRVLLTAADATAAGYRRELRNLKARIARASARPTLR